MIELGTVFFFIVVCYIKDTSDEKDCGVII